MQTLFHDLRYALRHMRRSPGFALTVALTFALGIGVNAAIFSVTYAILLKNLPVPNPGQLIRYTFKKGDMDIGLSGPMYDAIRKRQAASTDVLAWSRARLLLAENGTAEDVHGALMSGNGFAVLELNPYLGRVFGQADDVSGGGPGGYKALLGYDYWQSKFHADSNVIGKSLTLNGTPVTVLGILPKGFQGLEAGQRADVVLPLAFVAVVQPQKQPYRDAAGSFWLTVIGRLRRGSSPQTARANLQVILPQIYRQADPTGMFLQGFFKSFALGVESGSGGRSQLRTIYRQPLLLLELLSGLLLLLCCTNVGLLMLARMSERRIEFALRGALGASGARLIGHVLLEMTLIMLPGLIAGIAAGAALARFLASMLGDIGEPSTLDVSANVTVFIFSAGMAVLTALLTGVWPAFNLRRTASGFDLKQSVYSMSRKTIGSWIIPIQVAVSIMLLVAALLLGSTFAHLYLEPSGFQGTSLAFADVNLSAAKLNPAQSAERAKAVLAELQSAPETEAAALMSMPPLRGWTSSTRLFSFDRHGSKHSDPEVWPEAVTPGYFETVGTRILAGRALTASDITGEKVCILSRSAANFFFPGEDAIGRLVYAGQDDIRKDNQIATRDNARRVVGVADDAHFFSLRRQADHLVYTAMSKQDLASGVFDIAVRSPNVAVAARDVRTLLQSVAPGSAPPIVYTYNDLLKQQLQRERMLISLSTCFGAIALLLVAVGLFGLLMRSVTQRTREIGIRMALGEGRASIFKTVLAAAMKRIVLGAIIGTLLAFASSRMMSALLFQTSAANPWVYLLAGVLLFAVVICAAVLPANRAASIEPMEALRTE